MRTLVFLGCLFVSTAALGATLVVQGEKGFTPGVASNWWTEGSAVYFQLSSADEAESVAGQLENALAGAEVRSKGDVVIVKGIPEATLLDQLSRYTVGGAGGADPLADLAGAGVGAVAFSTPEGGGSIRATNPTFAIPAGVFGPPSKAQRVEAQVLSVERKTFPGVVLKVKVKRRASDPEMKKKYKVNSVIEAPVLMVGGDGSINFEDDQTRRNLVAYYLEPGDRVWIHTVTDESKQPHIDWIERKKK
ncbi:MAG: hypothetical protein AAF658_04470 [Myxococcota bacterium]